MALTVLDLPYRRRRRAGRCCGHPGQQGAGVGDDLLPLLLIARQLVEALGVGVAHRHQLAVLDREDVVLGEHSVALFAHLAHPLGVGGVEVDGLRLPPGQERQLVGGTGGVQKLVQRQAAQLLQEGQLVVQCSLQNGGQGTGSGLPNAHGLGLQHGDAQVGAPVGGALEQHAFKLCHGVAHAANAVVSGRQAVDESGKSGRHGVAQQGAKDHKPVQAGVPFMQFHSPVSSILNLFWYILFQTTRAARTDKKSIQRFFISRKSV